MRLKRGGKSRHMTCMLCAHVKIANMWLSTTARSSRNSQCAILFQCGLALTAEFKSADREKDRIIFKFLLNDIRLLAVTRT